VLDDTAITCAECHRSVDEFTAIKKRWRFWSDAVRELLPYCPECAKQEFEHDAHPVERSTRVPRGD
jgi:hypothetical protein